MQCHQLDRVRSTESPETLHVTLQLQSNLKQFSPILVLELVDFELIRFFLPKDFEPIRVLFSGLHLGCSLLDQQVTREPLVHRCSLVDNLYEVYALYLCAFLESAFSLVYCRRPDGGSAQHHEGIFEASAS